MNFNMLLPDINSIYGFKSTSPSVMIFKNGKPFYYRTNKDGILFFNIPSGKYEVLEGKLTSCTPVIYPTLNLDKRNNFNKVEKLKIIIAPNKNKATIDLENNYAIIDPKLADLPEYTIKWFMGHELWHNFYRGLGQISEQACDKGSADTMLKIGYNPNQCIAAIRGVLSNNPNALKRKSVILNELNQIKNGIITAG